MTHLTRRLGILIALAAGVLLTVLGVASGLPTGATCTFNPTSVDVTSTTTSIATQLTITTTANMAASTSPVAVKGVSGAASASASVSLAVTATAQTFSLSSPTAGGTLSVAQGQVTGAVNITVISSSTPSSFGARLDACR